MREEKINIKKNKNMLKRNIWKIGKNIIKLRRKIKRNITKLRRKIKRNICTGCDGTRPVLDKKQLPHRIELVLAHFF